MKLVAHTLYRGYSNEDPASETVSEGKLVVRETELAELLGAPVVLRIGQLGAAAEVDEEVEPLDEPTDELDEEAEEPEEEVDELEDGGEVDAELVVEVVEVVELDPERATYAPTIITRMTITTMPINAPLARALF